MWNTYFCQPSWCVILFNKQYRAEARRERSTAEKFKREKNKYIIQYGANFSTVASDLLKRETHNVSKPKHWWHNENRLCKVQKQYKQLNNNNLILALKGDSHRFTYLRGSCGKQMVDGVDIAHVVLPVWEVQGKKQRLAEELISLVPTHIKPFHWSRKHLHSISLKRVKETSLLQVQSENLWTESENNHTN